MATKDHLIRRVERQEPNRVSAVMLYRMGQAFDELSLSEEQQRL